MRFYTGVSYRFKTKTIIKFLIALGFLILATIGIDRVNAWTFVNTNENSSTAIKNLFSGYSSFGTNFYNSSDGEVVSYDCDWANNAYCGCSMDTDRSNTTYRYWWYKTGPSSAMSYLTGSYRLAINTDYPSNDTIAPTSRGTTDHDIYYLKNNNHICTNDSSNRSVDFQGSFAYNSSTTSYLTSFNSNLTMSNIFRMYIKAFDDTNEKIFSTPCEVVYNTSSGNIHYYSFMCENVFIGNNDNTIDKFGLDILNFIPFEDQYKGTGHNSVNGTLMLNVGTWNLNSYNALQYECSDNDPIVEGGFDNTIYLDDAATRVEQEYDPNVPGVNPDIFNIAYPENIQELLSLPLYIANNIVENSNTCVPYDLDFSSIMEEWSTSSSSYHIILPCMRTKLPDLLGSTFYNLVDSILAAIVFYNIALAIVQLINVITSGADLYSYYYSRSGKKDGLHVNHETGEVS